MMTATGEGDFRVLGEDEHDVTMEELGDKSRPPDKPPDTSGSWAQIVTRKIAGGMPVPEDVLNEEFVEARLSLEFLNGEDGEPVITIGREVLEAMNGLWKRCMIVKVLGRHIPITVLNRKLREFWRPRGAMYVMDLPRQIFMIRFEEEEEYMAALTGGPWRAFGSYLMVQAWSPDCYPLKDEIMTTPVWVRVSNIPVNFYHKSILMGIAKGLGKPIKVDLTTLKFERARFARVCVEINLKRPLKGSVLVNGDRYYVSYEGLTNICSIYGMYGHMVHSCPTRVQEQVEAMVIAQSAVNVSNAEIVANQTGDGFVPVRRNGKHSAQGRRQAVMTEEKGRGELTNSVRESRKGVNLAKVVISNRFGELNEDTQSPVLRESRNMEENKENYKDLNTEASGKRGGKSGEIVFGAEIGRKINRPCSDGRNKNNGHGKAHESHLNRSKLAQMAKPGQGLIFGPARGELELSVNGKRLRVEKENMGRSGGSVMMERKVNQTESDTMSMKQDEPNRNWMVSGEGEHRTEVTLHRAPSGMTTGVSED